MYQTHLYLVTPPKHQPEWPVNDNEPSVPVRNIDVAISVFCALIFLGLAGVGIALALVSMGVL